MEDNQRMRILEMIERGEVTAEEGLRLLEALNEVEASGDEAAPALADSYPPDEEAFQAEPAAEPAAEMPFQEEGPQVIINQPPGASIPPEAEKWRSYWTIPLWIGVGVVVVGGLLMYWAQTSSGLGFWFVCASLPFILGVLLLVLAFQSRTAPWLHLRVQQRPGESPQRIAFSFPIPVGITAWGLRTFGRYIPKLENTSLDEIVLALGETRKSGTPLYIQVDEGEDEEKVEIFIG
ncbi:MAG: hypothetical protein AB1894_14770 [Chloroflexota bacterium]